jgi:hypothetical protein
MEDIGVGCGWQDVSAGGYAGCHLVGSESRAAGALPQHDTTCCHPTSQIVTPDAQHQSGTMKDWSVGLQPQHNCALSGMLSGPAVEVGFQCQVDILVACLLAWPCCHGNNGRLDGRNWVPGCLSSHWSMRGAQVACLLPLASPCLTAMLEGL